MSPLFVVYAVLFLAIVAFVSDRIRLDVVAMTALLTLTVAGILSPAEALAGFSDPTVVLIVALFIVGEGIQHTGLAAQVGRLPSRWGGTSPARVAGVLMLLTAGLSGFMSSTGAVAIMVPVTVGVAARLNTSPSRLLMPVAFSAQLGGMLTLIGTSPNLIVSAQLDGAGLKGFGFFSFLPIGLPLLLVGVVVMVYLGPRLLAERAPKADNDSSAVSISDLSASFGISDRLRLTVVSPLSNLVGQTLEQANLRQRYGVSIVGLRRAKEGEVADPTDPATSFMSDDRLLVKGAVKDLDVFVAGEELTSQDLTATVERHSDVGIVEVLLTPRSTLVGSTLKESQFRDRFGVNVLAVKRGGEPLSTALRDVTFRFGDSLLVSGPWPRIEQLRAERRDFIVVTEPREMDDAGLRRDRAVHAAVICLGMLLAMTFSLAPVVVCGLIAAVLMVVSGAVRADMVYRSVSWPSIVLLAAMFPMATALEHVGALDTWVRGFEGVASVGGAYAVFVAFMLATSLLSQFISNTATTVLLAPVGLQAALALGVSPYPILMGIAIASSTAYCTPIASPVNTLVFAPGAYRFADYVRLGVCLQIVVLAIATLLIPIVFPFHPG